MLEYSKSSECFLHNAIFTWCFNIFSNNISFEKNTNHILIYLVCLYCQTCSALSPLASVQHTVIQEARARRSLIRTDTERHLPPGPSETFSSVSASRWPQDGGERSYYSKYLTKDVECQKLYPFFFFFF